MNPIDREKRAAALAAVAEVRGGMVVGLGTGSTAAYAIAEIGRLCREGLRIEAVATSLATEAAARSEGIPLIDFAALPAIDLCIDGVDEIDPSLRAIKGAGGAMLRERIVAEAATRMIAIADAGKPVETLGRKPLPVEVLPFALTFACHRIKRLGAAVSVRMVDRDVYRTDQGNAVIDCHLSARTPAQTPAQMDVEAFAASLPQIPGVLAHGLFLREIDAVYIAAGEQVTVRERTDGR